LERNKGEYTTGEFDGLEENEGKILKDGRKGKGVKEGKERSGGGRGGRGLAGD